MIQNYELVYYVAQKWVNYMDTGLKYQYFLDICISYKQNLCMNNLKSLS